MVARELLDRDHKACVACCKNIFFNLPAKAFLIIDDKAHLHLSGFVKKQNFCYLSESNLRELHERPLHSERVTVCCAAANFGVWGPYFFKEEEKAVSVTSARYVQMLQNFFTPNLKNLRENATVWFQQDGATAHAAKKLMDVLRGLFPGHLISLHGDIRRRARSPDFSPCDYFL